MYNDRAAYPLSYVKTLEDRVRQLEASLEAVTRRQPLPQIPGDECIAPASVDTSVTYTSHRPSSEGPAAERHEPGSDSQLATGMGLLSSCAAAEPHYFGFSAGLSLAHFVQVAIDFGSTSSDLVSLPLLAERPFANQALHTHNTRTTPASMPSPRSGTAYIQAYLVLIHPLYPFLDRFSLWQLHRIHTGKKSQAESGQDQGAASAHQETRDGRQMDLALLHLVYAIGSRCLQLLGRHHHQHHDQTMSKTTPEGHFLRAMQIIGDGLKFTSIRSIELTLLLAIHSMRSPSGTSVWHLAGLAIRQCIELGLHKQRAVEGHQAIRADQYRKRLFWSAYIFERKTALVLGRPFALSDEEIDLPLPLNIGDEGDEPQSYDELSFTLRENSGGGGGDWPASAEARTSLSFHRAHIELYQLHTPIRLALYQLKKSPDRDQLRAKMASLLERLDAWKTKVLRTFDDGDSAGLEQRTSFAARTRGRQTELRPIGGDRGAVLLGDNDGPTTHSTESSNSSGSTSPAANGGRPLLLVPRSAEVEKTELLLEYHKARRSLLQPLMTEGRGLGPGFYPFEAADYAACAEASGQICQLYRRLHRLAPGLPFSLRDLHAVFVAGFTLLYAVLCAGASPSIYTPQRARDIGACSTLLYVITEQWAAAQKYRDAFEVVAEKVEEAEARKASRRAASAAAVAAAQQQQEDATALAVAGSELTAEDASHLSYDGAPVYGEQPASLVQRGPHAPPTPYPTATLTGTSSQSQPFVYGAIAKPANTDAAEESSPLGEQATATFNGLSTDIGLDLEADIYGIEGLLYNEGLDWFTEAVL